MEIYKEVRCLSADSIRNLCIRMNWYTKGNCEEYSELLQMCDCQNVTVKEVHAIALNIMEHSADTERPFTSYMYEIGRCVNTYYEEADVTEIKPTEEICMEDSMLLLVDREKLLKECCKVLYDQAEFVGQCMTEKEIYPTDENDIRCKRARSNFRGKKEIFRILCKHLNENTEKYFDVCDEKRREVYSELMSELMGIK